MGRPQIDEKAYVLWAKIKFVEYTSCSIPTQHGKTKRLVFSVSLDGTFKVTLGSDVLYLGGSFYIAQIRFENAH